MINLITGVPGSGKTYLAIKTLIDQHFYWHKKDHCFYRKKESQKYEIFTNIDDLKLPHKNLKEIFKDQKLSFDQFFTPDYQDKLHQKYPNVIYLIDECQQYIPYSYKNANTILYFDTHRHYGDKIILITQDSKKISISISTLVEIEYRAVKSTFSLFGEFRYNVKSSGDIFERKTTKKDKRIFALYKSFQGDDQEQKRNYVKYYIVAFVLAFLSLGYYFYQVRLKDIGGQTQQKKESNPTEFKDQKRDYLSEVNSKSSETLDMNQIRSFKILQFVAKADNTLIAYQCPITQKWFNQSENPYKIVQSGTSYYIFLSLEKLTKLRLETNFIQNTISSSSPPPPPHN